MKFIEKMKYFFDKKRKNELNSILQNLPNDETICKDILVDLKNNTTKINIDNEIKNSYYVYLNDTIYISSKEKSKNDQNNFSKIVLVAHECRHSIQNKLLQKINFIASNIELILFAISFLVLIFLNRLKLLMLFIYIIFVILSFIPRCVLEIDAIIHSLKLSKKYMDKKLDKRDSDFAHEILSFQIKIMLPFFLIQLICGKLVRIGILILLCMFR